MKNATKKAWLMSVLSLVLCVAMLAGSTFAWFTDTASTGVNTIQAGNLDVQLMNADGTKELGETPLTWVKATGAENETVWWEPGCTYDLESFRIRNNGNLALKYKVIINGIVGNARLLEVIDFTVTVDGQPLVAKDGTSTVAKVTDLNDFEGTLAAGAMTGKITITGTMRAEAGNEYMNETIDGISITVVATQDTVESDSTGNTYDEDATYLNTDAEGNLLIGTAAELRYFALTVTRNSAVYEGKTIRLTNDIDLSDKVWIPMVANAHFTFDGNGKTIYGLTTSGEKNVGFFGAATKVTIRHLTVDGATVTGINHVAAIAGDALCTTIENCTVRNSTIVTMVKNNDDGDKAGAVAGYLSAEPNASVIGCTVEKCTVQGYRDIGGLIGYANKDAVITGNQVKEVTLVNDRSNNYKNYTTDAEFDVTPIVGEYNGNTLDESNGATKGNVRIKLADGFFLVYATEAPNKVWYEVDNVAGLKKLASDVNSGISYRNYTVRLTADVDLENQEWTPIGRQDKTFQGIFDGQGHTISNLYIHNPYANNVGLFGYTTEGEVRNFTLHNADVTGYLDVGAVAGMPYTSRYTNIRLTGDIKVKGFAYVGGMFGKNAYADLTDLTIDASEGSFVKAESEKYRTYVGGVVGFMGEGNITVKNVTSNIDVIGSTCDVGGIVGIAHYGNTFINCHSSGDVTLTGAQDPGDELEIGGIAGVWLNQEGKTVTLTGCTYTGTLSSTNRNTGTVTEFENSGLVGRKYNPNSDAGTLIIN